MARGGLQLSGRLHAAASRLEQMTRAAARFALTADAKGGVGGARGAVGRERQMGQGLSELFRRVEDQTVSTWM